MFQLCSQQLGNYIKYKSSGSGDRNKTLFIEQYFNKIRPYLEGTINNIGKSMFTS